nr:MAG TPA: hypothetical protein [Caudoviricetes sp.]
MFFYELLYEMHCGLFIISLYLNKNPRRAPGTKQSLK